MIDNEAEYKKILLVQGKWAKHWLTNSANRNHSNTIGLKQPANKTLEVINVIKDKDISYKEKVEKLIEFYTEEKQNAGNSKWSEADYYSECIGYIKRSINNIENGIPITIPKMANYK